MGYNAPHCFFRSLFLFLRLFYQFKLTSLGYSDVFDNHQHYLQVDVSSFCSLGQQLHKFQLCMAKKFVVHGVKIAWKSKLKLTLLDG